MPTEITAQEARELAADYREGALWCGRENLTAAALEQLARLLEQEATAMEALKACQCENCTRLMPSVAAGEKMDAARLLREQLAVSRIYISKLERDLSEAKADAGHFRELRRLLIRDRWMLLSMVNVADEGECPDHRFGIELAESNREYGFETLGEAISAAAREGAEHGE